MNARGQLHVIFGPMFSGKTEELLRRLRLADRFGLAVLAAKPAADSRTEMGMIVSHAGTSREGITVDSFSALGQYADEADVVGVDEAQFFSDGVEQLIRLRQSGKLVVVAGLDLDFRRRPFGCMPAVIAVADHAKRLRAGCTRCGLPADFTQRFTDGLPARLADPTVVPGGSDRYQPRCGECFEYERAVPSASTA